MKKIPETFKFDRIKDLGFKFGAHVGSSGGISNAVINARNIGANSFAVFLKSPRQWTSKPLDSKEIDKFKQFCQEYSYNPATDILPHGSYLINLANPDDEKSEKSFGCFVDDLKRCEQLGIGLYNFHPGSALKGGDHRKAIEKLASNINRAIKETSTVKIVIENMAGHGDIIGSNLQDIRDVIDMVDDKKRVGVCIDTCHAFAAGYDIGENWSQFWEQYDEIIGFDYLCAIHLNDSKAPLGANRDLHQFLGQGFLGLECFRLVANDDRLKNMPIILETPVKDDDTRYGEEIKLLEWLMGKTATDTDFQERQRDLAAEGAKERKDHQAKYDDKKAKESKKRAPPKAASATRRKKIKTDPGAAVEDS
ncbi:hypothetical protein DIURU_002811 [Diutina rugosa]|uniref:Apurinic-apyrimidinic endonuclease 1 n=1 Tax=Diutina rugosa TaxID=5481 RepID=A0A642UT11_DIURU|nr:uncharacterized protein DIURU_002811 [Diutina rugosa]KAA8902357.1 hypothetical protein DIURU_002811 [Diutina rugosa]